MVCATWDVKTYCKKSIQQFSLILEKLSSQIMPFVQFHAVCLMGCENLPKLEVSKQ